ncbi:methyl-accepting chemotaxis protein [Psychrobacillus psychrotolerans]|uniref:Methyl-accepting chemotaxis protein n=1 Tax=Psychrobacillus psychrotolerans TaxID=126156 RepID=A0A1I5ZB60_9BACI|nr:methyl-accepting chemotaxis protein [Psychrobacillus psychrotolerans]SFQ53618.1 methyl-accepting chemotaxis protein [Psychrobacillus psychrotolerans]
MKWTIGRKMWLGFITVLVLLIAVSVSSLMTIMETSDKYKFLLDDRAVKVNLVADIEISQKDTSGALMDYLLFTTDASRASVEEHQQITNNLTAELRNKMFSEETLEMMTEFEKKNDMFAAINADAIKAKMEKDTAAVNKLTANAKTTNADALVVLEKIEKFLQDDMDKTREELTSYEFGAKVFVSSLAALGVLLGVILAYFISRSISAPVKRVTAGLTEIATGNLLVDPIVIKNNDEVGEMATAFNTMSKDLRDIVSEVRDSSTQLAANAEELSASSEESLASSQMVAKSAEAQMVSSEQQVHHMDSSVQSLTELSQGIGQISVSNEEMLVAANDVQKLVHTGSDVVSDVAKQMDTIHTTFNDTTIIMKNMAKHSNDIQTVTALITDISEQTNLLALNAAIEAARAGEYGKGFAVVADEVRKLAEQSKNSATEIASMVQLIQSASGEAVLAITDGGEKVEAGIAKTTESLKVFQGIEEAVGEVGLKVESVSAAIEQIQAMAESVSQGAIEVQRLATLAADGANDTSAATEQQIAANEEISSNAQALADLAEALQNNVSHFKI